MVEPKEFLKEMLARKWHEGQMMYRDSHECDYAKKDYTGSTLVSIDDKLVLYNPAVRLVDNPHVSEALNDMTARVPAVRELMINTLKEHRGIGYDIELNDDGEIWIPRDNVVASGCSESGLYSHTRTMIRVRPDDTYWTGPRVKQTGDRVVFKGTESVVFEYTGNYHHKEFCLVNEDMFDFISSSMNADDIAMNYTGGMFFFEKGVLKAHLEEFHPCKNKKDIENLKAA